MDYEFSYYDAPIRPYVRENGARVFGSLKPARTVTVEQCREMITSGALRALTERVRAAATADAMRDAKQTLLPYVTPAGVFRERRATAVTRLSGCFVIDVDHLDTAREAEELRDAIGHDSRLAPLLTFVSPSGRGVKALVPWQPWRGEGWRGDEERTLFGDTPDTSRDTPDQRDNRVPSVPATRGEGEGNAPRGAARPYDPAPLFSVDPRDPTPEHLEDWARAVREAMMYVAWTYGIGEGAAGVDTACKDVSRACFLCHDGRAVAAGEER